MNKISFKFTEEGGLTENFQGAFKLILNDRKTTDFLEEAGFILSAEQEGLFPMFVGSCQIMGCCGTYIEVKHQADKVIWTKFWHGGCSGKPEPEDAKNRVKFLEDFIIKPPLEFDLKEYKATAEELRTALRQMPTRYEYFLKEYEQYKSGDLSTL